MSSTQFQEVVKCLPGKLRSRFASPTWSMRIALTGAAAASVMAARGAASSQNRLCNLPYNTALPGPHAPDSGSPGQIAWRRSMQSRGLSCRSTAPATGSQAPPAARRLPIGWPWRFRPLAAEPRLHWRAQAPAPRRAPGALSPPRRCERQVNPTCAEPSKPLGSPVQTRPQAHSLSNVFIEHLLG